MSVAAPDLRRWVEAEQVLLNTRSHLVAARTGAQALVDVAAYKNADALVHVVRAFRDESVAHPSGSVNPARDAQAMEDELLLADLGVAERRLERIQKDLKKGRSAELEKERDLVQRCKDALEAGTPLRALQLAGEDLKRLRGFQFLSAKPLLLVINLDEADLPEVGAADEPGRIRGTEAGRLEPPTSMGLEARERQTFVLDGVLNAGFSQVIEDHLLELNGGVALPDHVALLLQPIDRERHRPRRDPHVACEVVERHRVDFIEVVEDARLVAAEEPLSLRVPNVAGVAGDAEGE